MSENKHYTPMQAISSRIIGLLRKEISLESYIEVEASIYKPINDFAAILEVGDTFEFPNGTMVMVTFKPKGVSV